jgi:uncharacterized membrane protein YeaQ/YmgE (transglycosylase-associated protein family)
MMFMAPAAAVALNPGGVLAWIVVGLIAGALAGRVVEGRGLGCLGDIVVGIVGAILGGLILGQLGLFTEGPQGFIGTLIVAFIGAVILLAVLRLITGARRP